MAIAERGRPALDGSPFDALSFSIAWLLALVTYGVGDVLTTFAIVSVGGVRAEANPVVSQAITNFGGGGFVGLKLLVFAACIAVSLWAGLGDDDRLMLYGPPLVLAAVGAYTTVHNLGLLVV